MKHDKTVGIGPKWDEMLGRNLFDLFMSVGGLGIRHRIIVSIVEWAEREPPPSQLVRVIGI